MKHTLRPLLHTIALIISSPLLSAGYTVKVTDAFIEKAGKIFEQPDLRPNPHVGASSLVTAAEKRVCRESAVAYMTAVFLEKHLATPTKKLDIAAPELSPVSTRWKNLLPHFEKEHIQEMAALLCKHGATKSKKKTLTKLYARYWLLSLTPCASAQIARELTKLIATEMVKKT